MTRAGIELRILSLYTGGCEAATYNISEIARATGAAYPHVYKAVSKMTRDGLLSVVKIGHAHYCRPNLANSLTRNLMERAALQQQTREQNLEREIQRLVINHPELLVVMKEEEKLTLLISTKRAAHRIRKDTILFNLVFLTPEEFTEHLRANHPGDNSLLKAPVLYGYERLLLLLQPVYDELCAKPFFRGGDDE